MEAQNISPIKEYACAVWNMEDSVVNFYESPIKFNVQGVESIHCGCWCLTLSQF